jgi:hypothetical protein
MLGFTIATALLATGARERERINIVDFEWMVLRLRVILPSSSAHSPLLSIIPLLSVIPLFSPSSLSSLHHSSLLSIIPLFSPSFLSSLHHSSLLSIIPPFPFQDPTTTNPLP